MSNSVQKFKHKCDLMFYLSLLAPKLTRNPFQDLKKKYIVQLDLDNMTVLEFFAEGVDFIIKSAF